MKNPKLFRELSEPFASVEEANAAIDAFFEDLGQIREKHRLTNVHVIVHGAMCEGDGAETDYMTSMHYGDSMRAQAMSAWSYGKETADHEALMRQIVAASAKRSAKP